MTTCVYIIEKKNEVLQGLRTLLKSCPAIKVSGDSSHWRPGISSLVRPGDVILLGTNGNSREAFLLLTDIRIPASGFKIIFLVDEIEEPAFVSRLMLKGLNGYMTKSAGAEELKFAIEKVSHDGIYICTAFGLKVLEKYPLTDGVDGAAPYNLTDGELAVLRLIAEGHTNKDIANSLSMSVRTIETRRKKLLEKTNTTNTATLIRNCVKAGVII
jgi:DNA-binding NarL/FixJ family response regulator